MEFNNSDWNELPPEDPNLLQASIGDQMADEIHVLRFCFLGCEPRAPYGPIRHTAELFLDLFSKAALLSRAKDLWIISIRTYDVQRSEYPDDWNFDGFILPGSFSAAFDSDEWICNLKEKIQSELVTHERPTLGICFGHQLLAHSFPDGQAKQVPTGARMGPHKFSCSENGSKLLNTESMEMLVTHGDMVEKLPKSAVSLGGDLQVPIQAAAYFKSGDADTPYAITFQGHPEFAASRDLGLWRSHHLITDVMLQKKAVTLRTYQSARDTADESFDRVQKSSVAMVLESGRSLGWFL